MVHTRRRVSYVVPPPVESVPRLQLPPFGISRLGSTGPLLIPAQVVVQDPEEDLLKRATARRPRHRLGVASLAIDTSTQLTGRGAPEGILYTGGRDGLVMAWDLGIPMKKKSISTVDGDGVRGHRVAGNWEVMTGWADEFIDEEAEEGDERLGSDGDILGDVSPSGSRRKWPGRTNPMMPSDDQWETDLDTLRPGNVCAQTYPKLSLPIFPIVAHSIPAMRTDTHRLGQRPTFVQSQPDGSVTGHHHFFWTS